MNGYAGAAKDSGIAVQAFPIVDVDFPREEQVEEFADLVGGFTRHPREGPNTVVHCRSGIRSTGTVAASVLVGLGQGADGAIEIVREDRSRRMVEIRPQEDYVREFAKRYEGRWSA